jgi:murein DD-endopeptidase MepM/ murein hydrolase activator NlpD
VLIGLGVFIMQQSEYVQSANQSEMGGLPVMENNQASPVAHPSSTLSHTRTERVLTGVVAKNEGETTASYPQEEGSNISSDPFQAASSAETSFEARSEETEWSLIDGDTVTTQRLTHNVAVKVANPLIPAGNGASGGPAKPQTPYRLTTPHVEVEASNWLQYGDENGEREDPVPFVWPAEKHWLSGYNYSIYHPGIDIAADWDDLVFSAASGKVITVHHSNRGYGNMVIINHLNGYQTLYAHLNTILAETGNFVIQGQPIGLAGTTGNSTGTHLHFEIYFRGGIVNPWQFLK